MIRLHKSAAIMLTKNPESLAEAEATEVARIYIGPRLSATVAWIDHRRVEALREALTRAGFTPRVTNALDTVEQHD